MSNEQRIAKCIGYCRFLQSHGVVWRDETHGNQSVGMVEAKWVDCCLSGLFDNEPDNPYLIPGCDCPSCLSEQARCGSPSDASQN